jgi:hypothetical protein
MQCIMGGRCITVCEDHWGDCNETYRDGCGLPIKDCVYCDGDPRIDELAQPIVGLFSNDEGSGPGHFDSSVFARGLGEQHARLTACYKALLKKLPDLHGLLLYRFTLDESGRISRMELVPGSAESQELERCVTEVVANVRFDHGPNGGTVAYLYRIAFALGTAPNQE